MLLLLAVRLDRAFLRIEWVTRKATRAMAAIPPMMIPTSYDNQQRPISILEKLTAPIARPLPPTPPLPSPVLDAAAALVLELGTTLVFRLGRETVWKIVVVGAAELVVAAAEGDEVVGAMDDVGAAEDVGGAEVVTEELGAVVGTTGAAVVVDELATTGGVVGGVVAAGGAGEVS